jgi:hypothetical protein
MSMPQHFPPFLRVIRHLGKTKDQATEIEDRTFKIHNKSWPHSNPLGTPRRRNSARQWRKLRNEIFG